jgi:hypothetical protein
MIKTNIWDVLLEQACVHVKDGVRFQFAIDNIGHENIEKFVNGVSINTGAHVSSYCTDGIIVVCNDSSDSDDIVMASVSIERKT